MKKGASLSCCIKDESRSLGLGNQILGSNYPMRHRLRAVVVSDREKAVKNCHVGIVKMNENEPLKRCRNAIMLSKPNIDCTFGMSFDVNWSNRQSGRRHKEGMSTIQALIRNMRTCRSDVKGEAVVDITRGESTDAEHRDGSVRSSDEGPVMGVERRGRIIWFETKCQLGTGGVH